MGTSIKSKCTMLIVALAACIGSDAGVCSAANGEWIQNSGSWGTTTNWTGGIVPGTTPGDVADLTRNFGSHSTITLDGVRTLGTLEVGDTTSSFRNVSFTPGTGGSFVFDSGTIGVDATLSAIWSPGNNLAISAPINFVSDTNISFTSTVTQWSQINLSGAITGSGAVNINSTEFGLVSFLADDNLSGYTGTINYTSNGALGHHLQLGATATADPTPTSTGSPLAPSGTNNVNNMQQTTLNMSVATAGGIVTVGNSLTGNVPVVTELGSLTGTGTINPLANPTTLRVGYIANVTNEFSGVLQDLSASDPLSFEKAGAADSTQILSGNNLYTGATTVSAGTLTIGASERIADASSLNVTGGTFDLNGFAETVGAVTLTVGSITAGNLIGTSYTLQNGTVSADLGGAGPAVKSTAGTVTLSGNNTFSGNLFFIDDGTLNLTGSHNTGSGAYIVGFGGGANATVNISGDLTIGSEGASPDYAMEIGTFGVGVVNQTGGTVTTGGSWGLIAIGDDAGGNGAYNLSGGVLDVAAGDAGAIFAGPGTASFGFTGGTLKVKIFNPTAANPGPPFLTGSGFVQGGLTQSNTDAASLLDVTGNDTAIFGNYNLLGGAVDIGASQTLSVSQDTVFSSGTTWNVQYDGVLESIALLDVNGTLDLGGVTLNFVDAGLGAALDSPFYILASYNGLSGVALEQNVPAGYFVNYAFGVNQIALQMVPEPGYLLLTCIGIFGVGYFRRRTQP